MSRKRVLSVITVAVSLLSPGQFAWAIGTTPPSWEPREVVAFELSSTAGQSSQDRALAYNHHGNPGIAFFDDANNYLRYARRVPGVGWVHSAVDILGDTGYYPSLAYDRYERPTISYASETAGTNLRYAHYNGSTWDLETVDSNNAGRYSSLAIDVLGQPAIAYSSTADTSLKYVHDTDGDFSLLDETPVTVSNTNIEGFNTSLVFDPLNRPMIAHLDPINHDLLFSLEEPGIGWITTTVASDLGTTADHSLAIDPDTGYPAIALYDRSLLELRFAGWDGASWNSTVVDTVGFGLISPSLAFDPADGNPAISYYSGNATDSLKLAWHDGISWQNQTVDAVGDVGLASSLAFNDFGSGFPSIAYLGDEDGIQGLDTLYFIDDPPATVPEPASVALLILGAVFVPSVRRRLARTV